MILNSLPFVWEAVHLGVRGLMAACCREAICNLEILPMSKRYMHCHSRPAFAFVALGFLCPSAWAMQSANCTAGANHVTSSSTSAQIAQALAASAAVNGIRVTANATAITQLNLGSLGLNGALLAQDGVFGTFTLTGGMYNPTGTSDPLALGSRINGLLSHTCESATVTVNTAGMNAAAIAAVCANIAKIDTIINLPADKTLILTAAELAAKFISGTGTVAIKPDGLATSANLLGITATNITFPTSAPFFSVAAGGQIALTPARASGWTIEGAGTVSLVGTIDSNVVINAISAPISLDGDGVVGTTVALGSTFTLTAAQANGLTITGAGTTVIAGNIAGNSDLTRITTALDVSGSVNAGAILTLTAGQAHNRTLTGAGSVAISSATSALVTDTNLRQLATAGLQLDGSIAATKTLSINAAQQTVRVSGAGTVDILGTSADDIVAATDISAPRVVRGLAGRDTLVGAASNDIIDGGADNDSVDGGAGIDTAIFLGSATGAMIISNTGSGADSALEVTTAIDATDTLFGIERLAFADATIVVVGRAGSTYTSLAAALAATSATDKLYGEIAFHSANTGSAADIGAILARVIAGSTVTADLLDMTAAQVAAINTHFASFASFSNTLAGVVRNGADAAYFTSIAAAIDFANDGDTVRVVPGIYSEKLTIAKNISVEGPNAAIAGNGVRGVEAILDFSASPTVVGGQHVLVTKGAFKGFRIQDSLLPAESIAAPRIAVRIDTATSATVMNNVFFRDSGSDGAAQDAQSTLDIRAIEINAVAGATATVRANTIDGATTGILQNRSWRSAIRAQAGAAILDNTIAHVRNAIELRGDLSLITVDANRIACTDGGVALSLDTSSASFNLGANAFNGVGMLFDLVSVPTGFTLDARASSVDGSQIAALDLAGQFAIAPRSNQHITNGARNGRVVTKLGEIHVPSSGAAVVGGVSRAMSLASTGDIVRLDAGSYSDNITITDRVTLIGAGSAIDATVVTAAVAGTSVVTVTGSGSVDGRLIVKDMRLIGSTASGILVANTTAVTKLTFDNINASANTDGISYGASSATTNAISDAIISNSTLSSNANNGIRIASTVSSFDGLTVSGCTIASNNWQGFSFNASGANIVATNFAFTNTTFTNNCASNANSADNHDLSFFGFKGNASLTHVAVTSNHAANGYGIVFNGQGLESNGGFAPAGIIALDNVSVSGQVAKGALSFQCYSDVSGVSLNNVSLQNCIAPSGDLVVQSTDTDALAAGNTALKSIVVLATGGVDAIGARFHRLSGSQLDRAVLADNFIIADQISDAIDGSGVGLVRFAADKLYVTTATPAGALGRAIAASRTGDTIVLQSGVAVVLGAVITNDILFSGDFTINAASFPTDASANAVLESFLARAAAGATFAAVTTGMNATQLAALGTHYAAFAGGVTGTLVLSSAQTASQIAALLAGSADGSATADATGMSTDQVGALSDHLAKFAADGITGTILVSGRVSDLAGLVAKTAASATLEADAATMSATSIAVVHANIARVNAIYNLTLSNEQSAEQISGLLSKSVTVELPGRSMARVIATAMASDKLSALSASIARLGDNAISGSVLLRSGQLELNDATIVTLFIKIAISADVRVDATAMGATTLTLVSANDVLVDSIFALALDNAQTTSELAILLGKSDDASAGADASGMASTAGGKLAILANNFTKLRTGGLIGAIAINANLTATQITSLLSRAGFATASQSGATVAVDALNMSVGQLASVAAAVASAGSPADQAVAFDISNLSLTSAQDASTIATLLNATIADQATVLASNMSAAQLIAIANGAAAVHRINGTFTITSALTSVQIAAVMANASSTATVTVNSHGMSPAQQQALFSTALLIVEANLSAAKGDIFVVDINMSGLSVPAVGMQVRVLYDATKMQFVGDASNLGGIDFPTPIALDASVQSGRGVISLSTGADLGGSDAGVTVGNAAHLLFRAVEEFCDATDLIELAPSGFPCRISSSGGHQAVPFTKLNFTSISSLEPMTFVGVPTDHIAVATDAGSLLGAALAEPIVTASNNCEPVLAVTHSITLPNSAVVVDWPSHFPIGTSTVSWSATDASGTLGTVTRTYTVANYQIASIDVNLLGIVNANTSFDNEVRLRLSSGNVMSAIVRFTGNNGAVVDAHLPVRNDYTCISVKDASHTLAQAQPLSISGSKWVTPAPFALIAGDSNDDNLVDIFDFASFVTDRGLNKTVYSRSNYDRNSIVNNGDFGSIGLNFLKVGENCGGGNFRDGAPRLRVSVKELRRMGSGNLELADINMDGWIDQADIALAMQGQFRRDDPNANHATDRAEPTRW